MDAIEDAARNYGHYQANIDLPTLEEVGKKYYEFAQTIYEDYLNGNYYPKQIKLLSIMKFIIGVRMKTLRREVLNKLSSLHEGEGVRPK